MRKMTKNVLFCLVLVVLLSCQTQDSTKKPGSNHFVTFSGKVSNPVENKINIYDRIRSRFEKFMDDTIVFDENGNFSYSFEIPQSGYYEFKYNKKPAIIYLHPGDSLYLETNADDFYDAMKFSGNGAEINNYLNDVAGKYLNKFNKDRSVYALEPDSFLQNRKTILSDFYKSFDEAINKYNIEDTLFQYLEKNRFWAHYAISLLRYKADKMYRKPDLELPDDFDDILPKINLNDSKLFQVQSYRMLMFGFIEVRSREKQNKESGKGNFISLSKEYFDIVEKNISNIEIKNCLLVDNTFNLLAYGMDSIAYVKEKIEYLKKNNVSQEIIQELEMKFQKRVALAPGNMAPKFTCNDIENKPVVLDDFKGKYVFIDFWATWCGPCRKQIPYLEKILEKYEGKDIAFVSITVDKKREPWEKMVKEKEMKGIQLHQGNSNIRELYQVRGIPHFMLIDKEGQIVKYRAPRPSSEELTHLLDSLLL